MPSWLEAQEERRERRRRDEREATRREEALEKAREQAREDERARERNEERRREALERQRELDAAERKRGERLARHRERIRADMRETRRTEEHAAERATARAEERASARTEEQRAEARAEERARGRAAERRDADRAERREAERATERRELRRAEAREAERAQERAAERRGRERADARASQRRTGAREQRRAERSADEAIRTRRAAAARRPPRGVDAASLQRLRVQGSLLLDTHDRPVVLRGFTFRGIERPSAAGAAFAPAVTDADVATLADWGATAAVVPIAQDLALLGHGDAEAEDYLAALDATVEALAEAGVYTLVQLSLLSSILPTHLGGAREEFEPSIPNAESLDLWAAVARRYASTPAVLFDLFRSPHDPEHGDALGALVPGLSWGLWRRWLLAMLGHVRREHPGAVVVARGLDRGRDLSGFPLRYSDGSAPPQLVYGAELHGDDGDENTLRALAALGRTQSVGVFGWSAGAAEGMLVEALGRRLARAGHHWIAGDWDGSAAPVVRPVGRLGGGPGLLAVPKLIAEAVVAQAPPPASCVVTEPFAPAELPQTPALDSPYLPSPTDVARAGGGEGGRQRVNDYLTLVRARWQQADGLGLVAMLDRVRATERLMAASAVQPIPGLPNNAPDLSFREGLMHDAGGAAETAFGRDLVLGTRTIPAVPSAADVVRAIMNLRRLDDVLLRVIVANAAAALSDLPLADVLALYRTEGDLGVPPDQTSLTVGIPPGRRDAATHLHPRPDISHLVWIVRPEAFSSACTDDAIREWALVHWFVQIAGLDDLGRSSASFGRWSSTNWLAAGRADAPATAQARWAGYRNLLAIARGVPSRSGRSSAILAHVVDPETLLEAVLLEAAYFLRRLGTVESVLGSLPPGHALAGKRLTPGMTYLHYHAQRSGGDVGDTVPMPKLKGIVLSAVITAAGTSGSRFRPLRQAIAGASALTALARAVGPGLALRTAAQTVAEAERRWPVIETWLGEADHLDLISDFIESAGDPPWRVGSWGELRGNMSRFRVQREYYRLLAAVP